MIDKSCQPKRQMSYAKTVSIVDGSHSECARINRARALLEILLVDPYVNYLRPQLQHLGNAETLAIGDGVVCSLKKFRRGATDGNRISHEDQWTREGLFVHYAPAGSGKEKAAENFFPQRLRV